MLSASSIDSRQNTLTQQHTTTYTKLYSALKNAGYGGNTDHLVFVGDSAGGQLALATTLRLKRI
ncbi:alpha/beta hydrolase fold domain-containing protein [Vibrio lentus]|nr:alpha/beta hydrolase fold domain-containing protein [Vibrio lentus]